MKQKLNLLQSKVNFLESVMFDIVKGILEGKFFFIVL